MNSKTSCHLIHVLVSVHNVTLTSLSLTKSQPSSATTGCWKQQHFFFCHFFKEKHLLHLISSATTLPNITHIDTNLVSSFYASFMVTLNVHFYNEEPQYQTLEQEITISSLWKMYPSFVSPICIEECSIKATAAMKVFLLKTRKRRLQSMLSVKMYFRCWSISKIYVRWRTVVI